MSLGSRLQAGEVRLAEIIAARPALSGVQVERGHPGTDLLQREAVWLDRARWTEQPGALGPRHRRDQDITFEIIVRVSQEGDDVGALKDRTYLLADEVEEALRADPGLDDAVEFGGVTSGESDSFADTDGRVCAIRLDATYKAHKG